MNSPLNSGMYYSNNEWKFVATAGVAWERTLPSKQTLFPVWGDKEDRKPRAGIPPPEVQSSGYTLRATKGVNMHPFPSIQITKVDGTPYTAEEEVRISLVGVDKQAPPQGSCTCKGQPILGESKPFQLTKKDNEVRCKFRGGYVELKKLQVGCCTGARGHGCSFCIKVEFIREGSPLKGLVCYSLPIEVGAKGPFAKAIGNSKKNSSSNDLPEPTTPTSSENSIVVRSAKRPAMALPPYDGAEEMFALLTQLNLQQYIQNFLDNEVDLQAFLQLTDEDLNQMGITKVGPKVKILKHIQKIRDETALPAPVLDPRSDFPSLESPFTHPSILEDPTLPISEPATKKRRLATSLDNIPTPPTILLDRLATPAVDINQISLFIYLSHVRQAKDKLQKTLFMVRSKKDRQSTEDVVQQIQNQVISKLKQEGKKPIFEGRAQMMLMLQGDKHGDWVARSQLNGQLWSFKKGDYIKIDNHHDVNVEIRVCQYFVGDGENNFVEDKTNSPKKYPVLGPGACLEIGIDDNKDGRISTASNLDTDPSETFAVTHNGKLMMSYGNFQSQTCIFSFKRRKTDMKKVESLDDFQKELFLSKCLEVDSM